jgi:hypothetical protein
MKDVILNSSIQATGVYLVHKTSPSRPAHFWTGTDTVCNRLLSLSIDNYDVVTSIAEDKEICHQCAEVAIKRRLNI